MFRAVPLPIVRSPFIVHLSLLYVIQVCRQLSSRVGMDYPSPARKPSTNLYDTYQCQVYSEWTPDDGKRNCPKHVEVHFLVKINLGNQCICWFYYKEIRFRYLELRLTET